MPDQTPGIHHVTAIAGDPQRNVDFYAGVLGLRPVKRTVNYDDPYTYHLYYGDELGRPGTTMTFFPWPDGRPGRRGAGQVTTVSFLIPPDSVEFWLDRLRGSNVDVERPTARFDEEVVGLWDPDGVRLELVAHESAADVEPWTDGPVPPEHAVRGFRGVTAAVEGYERTADLLTDHLGLPFDAEENGRHRFAAEEGGLGSVLDLCPTPDAPGSTGVGTVHHVAVRAADEDEQAEFREALVEAGFDVTPVVDRGYFRSIYFREPGGVLFEVATDGPGFTVDEPEAALGTRLMLPEWLEDDRATIERRLPPVRLPGEGTTGPARPQPESGWQ